MTRFELIDKKIYTIYEFDNSIDIHNDWSVVACLNKFDQYNYNQLTTCLITMQKIIKEEDKKQTIPF